MDDFDIRRSAAIAHMMRCSMASRMIESYEAFACST